MDGHVQRKCKWLSVKFLLQKRIVRVPLRLGQETYIWKSRASEARAYCNHWERTFLMTWHKLFGISHSQTVDSKVAIFWTSRGVQDDTYKCTLYTWMCCTGKRGKLVSASSGSGRRLPFVSDENNMCITRREVQMNAHRHMTRLHTNVLTTTLIAEQNLTSHTHLHTYIPRSI